ncbi:MAG: hypothetical protein P1U89_01480 [Verrucomicrobiales bacterium]|nr:hypothetical protein [Verrucomicrobiales bacterium]
MGLFDSKESKEKKSHFKNMISLAMIDGDYDESEHSFLVDRGMVWGLTRKEVDAVLKDPQKIKFVVPDNPDKCIAQLYDLIVMMLADGVIQQDEMDFVQTLATRMGFRPSDVPRMLEGIIEQARENQKPDIDANEFLNS